MVREEAGEEKLAADGQSWKTINLKFAVRMSPNIP